MKWPQRIVWLSVAWLFVHDGCAAPPEGIGPDPARGRGGYYAQPGRAYIGLPAMPKPIKPREIDRWSHMLRLSEAQEVDFWRLYAEYLAAEQQVHDQFVQPLWDRSAEIRDGAPPHLGLDRALQLKRLVDEDRPGAVRRIAVVEDAMFRQLQESLAETQLPRMAQVRAQRERMRCDPGYARYPGGHLDLTVVMMELEHNGADCTPTNPDAFDALISAYDAQITPLFIASAEADIEIISKAVVVQADHHDGNIMTLQARAEQRTCRGRLVAAQKRITEANARFVGELAALLQPATGAHLLRVFNETVYPPVFPDPTDLGTWYEVALALPTLDEKRRKDILALQTLSETRRTQLCEGLKKAYLDYREEFGIAWGGNSFNDYAPGAYDLHAQRVANARDGMRMVSLLLTSDEQQRMHAASEAAEQQLAVKFLADPARGS